MKINLCTLVLAPLIVPMFFLSGCAPAIKTSAQKAYEFCHIKDFDAARVEYEKALKLDPRNDCLLNNFIICATNSKKYETAEAAVRQLELLPPVTVSSLRILGRYYYKIADYKKAQLYYSSAVLKEPSGEDYYYLARIKERQKLSANQEWRLASFYYEIDSHKDSQDSQFWSDYGHVLEKVKNYPKAIEAFSHALELDNTNQRAVERLGILKHRVSKRAD